MAAKRKVIITCAITGSIHTPTMSPYLPITAQEIAEAAIGAAEAGAAIVHLHARDPKDGRPDQTPTAFEPFLKVIKQRSDCVVNITTGGSNIMIGNDGVAGDNLTTRIGAGQARAFVAGIRGVTTGQANAIAVVIDSNGQLGTLSSSRAVKQDIADMGAASDVLMQLRPVTFHYKSHAASGQDSLQYGLVAEEVAEVFPDLVVRDEEGQPFTVKYHLLSAMLLNELQKLHRHGVDQAGALRQQARELEEQRIELTRLRRLETRVDALESRTHL